MDTVGPLIDPSWANFCRARQKLYNFFDPPRQLREGLHMLPLLSLLAGQPELAALFSFTDAALYAREGNIKGTILAGLGALPIAGLVGKAVATAGEAAEVVASSRALAAAMEAAGVARPAGWSARPKAVNCSNQMLLGWARMR